MPSTVSDTAHRAWDKQWATERGRSDWLRPETEVVETAARLFENGFRRALDLGCGIGRHAIHLAHAGYSVCAMDMSEVGLNELRTTASARNLVIETHHASMTSLPFGDQSFDYVVSYNVFCHGNGDVVTAAVSEARRVLRDGGILQATMLSSRSTAPRRGREVAPNTFVWDDGDADHHHPHYFCDTARLNALFNSFEWLRVEDRQDAVLPEYWHWHVIAERKG
ncbi:class I SAM-dependent methyltransferase [Bradyrhizobium sp. Arg62]|uniref:class I SAM-dependent methyltransferase n=1 Tax=Bradyrhizobium brasilense TaxID=1419277 RepID=UPI001E39E707|nr:class I SAM-dependent methyltransferase [Bradyrhizobium brasilense]MCC8944223.1 class I SAM-dependent methyltransferase [Bradyrhizobium brasilense]